jgi:hypothetical protein
MITAVGGKAFLAYLTPQATEKIDLNDLYVKLGRDVQRFRQHLEEATRPAEATELLTWLVRRWKDWPAPQQEKELSRALRLQVRLLDDPAFELWCGRAGEALHIKKKLMATMVTQARPSQTPKGDDDWFSAHGYIVNKLQGVLRVTAKDEARVIANAPINITEKAVDEAGGLYLTVEFSYGGERKTVTKAREQIYGRELLDLARYGAPLTQNNVKAVQEFLQDQEKETLRDGKLREVKLLTEFGWASGAPMFALGREVIGGSNVRCVAFADQKFLEALAPRGSERTYLDLCREVRAQSPFAELMWAAGYAAPLIRLLGKRSLVFSAWGRSGSGKSALQSLAVSPYGRPEGIKIGGDISPAGLEGVLLRSRDTPVYVDDTQLTKS